MNSNSDNYNLFLYNTNIILALSSKEENPTMVIELLKNILLSKSTLDPEFFPNIDNYEIKLCGLLILMKNISEHIDFQFLSKEKRMVIRIKKSVEYTDFQLFSKLFEELSLYKLNFANYENEWKAELSL